MKPNKNKEYPVIERLGRAIPHTGLNFVWRNLEKSVLDVGCGKGHIGSTIVRSKSSFSVGVDLFKPYISVCKAKGTHHDYVLCDVRLLPFKARSLDTSLCMEVLEHLEKADGLNAIAEMERVAKSNVILSAPVGVYNQSAFDGNPLQEHRSQWTPSELKRLNYEVQLFGVRGLRGEKRLGSVLPESLQLLDELFGPVLCLLLKPLINSIPGIASHMMCVKRLRSIPNSKRIAA